MKDGAVNLAPWAAVVLGAGWAAWGILQRYNAYRGRKGLSRLNVDTSVLLTTSILGVLFFGVLGLSTFAYEHFWGSKTKPPVEAVAPPTPTPTQPPAPPKRHLTTYEIEAKLKAIDMALSILKNDIEVASTNVEAVVEDWKQQTEGGSDPQLVQTYQTSVAGARGSLEQSFRKLGAFINQNPQEPEMVAPLKRLNETEAVNSIIKFEDTFAVAVRVTKEWPDIRDLTDASRALLRSSLARLKVSRDDAAEKLVELRKGITQ